MGCTGGEAPAGTCSGRGCPRARRLARLRSQPRPGSAAGLSRAEGRPPQAPGETALSVRRVEWGSPQMGESAGTLPGGGSEAQAGGAPAEQRAAGLGSGSPEARACHQGGGCTGAPETGLFPPPQGFAAGRGEDRSLGGRVTGWCGQRKGRPHCCSLGWQDPFMLQHLCSSLSLSPHPLPPTPRPPSCSFSELL